MAEIQIHGSNNSTSLVLSSNAASITTTTPVDIKTETIDVSNNPPPNNNSVIDYSVMSEVKALGKLNCLVKYKRAPNYGNYDDSTNTWSGIDVDYCRAIAAVLGVEADFSISISPTFTDPSSNEWVEFFNKENNAHIAIRQVTPTAGRDLVEFRPGLSPVDFGPVYVYDVNCFMLRDNTILSNPPTLQDLNGLKIAVGKGTTQGALLPALLAKNNVTATVIDAPTSFVALGGLADGTFDAVVADYGAVKPLVQLYRGGVFAPLGLTDPSLVPLPNTDIPLELTFGLSPLAPVVFEKDHAMQEAAYYALQAIILASVDGITKAHLESGGTWLVPDISNDNFVSDWAKKAVIAFGGNYKERIEHYSLNNIPGNYNKTYNEGGLIANIALA